MKRIKSFILDFVLILSLFGLVDLRALICMLAVFIVLISVWFGCSIEIGDSGSSFYFCFYLLPLKRFF